MNRRALRDRLLVGGIGLLLATGGILGLLQSYGAFGEGGQSEPVLLEDVRAFVGRNEEAFWAVLGGVALLLAYLGARWLLAELRVLRRPEPLRVAQGIDSIVVDLSALAEAVGADLERELRVGEADVTFAPRNDAASANIRLVVHDDMPLSDLRAALGTGPLSRLAHALDQEHVESRVLVTFAPVTRQLT